MVQYCILCKQIGKADASVSFHIFPKDENQRRKWLEAINMDQVAKSARLCSNHFKSTDFQETICGQRRSIKKTAIPTIISSYEINNDIKNEAASIEEQCHTEIKINTRNLENTAEEQLQEQSNRIAECSMEYNDDAKDNSNSLKRKSMGDDPFKDVPFKNIRSMKNLNMNEISKKTG